jgi:hypothetical protein
MDYAGAIVDCGQEEMRKCVGDGMAERDRGERGDIGTGWRGGRRGRSWVATTYREPVL